VSVDGGQWAYREACDGDTVMLLDLAPLGVGDAGPLEQLTESYRLVATSLQPATTTGRDGARSVRGFAEAIGCERFAVIARGAAAGVALWLGIGVATIEHRLGPSGRFPAAVHDLHGAIRWLGAHGADHGLATERIGAWGSSSGAHLSLVAALARDSAIVGEVGGSEDSGGIDAVVSFFATSDLAARAARSAMERHLVPPGPEHAFLGLDGMDDPAAAIRRAREASPLTMVHADAPPMLLVHGDADQLVPFSQSRHMHDAVVAVGGRSTLVCLGGAGHEDAAFDQPFVAALVAQFLRDTLTDSA
jgi:acetyl esterase/lipase